MIDAYLAETRLKAFLHLRHIAEVDRDAIRM